MGYRDVMSLAWRYSAAAVMLTLLASCVCVDRAPQGKKDGGETAVPIEVDMVVARLDSKPGEARVVWVLD